MANERLVYYKTKFTFPYQNMLDTNIFELVFNEYMSTQQNFHDAYGKDGFLSEKTNPDNFERNATIEANRIVDQRDITVEMNRITTSDETFEQDKKRIEKLPDFIDWIT